MRCPAAPKAAESRSRGRGARPTRPGRQRGRRRAGEVKALLLGRLAKEEAAPPFVFDAGCDPVELQQQGLEGIALSDPRPLAGGPLLLRRPEPRRPPPALTGLPRRHGPKMKCADPSTWPEPSSTEVHVRGHRLRGGARARPGEPGRTCIRRVRAHERRGSRGPSPVVVRGTLRCWWRSSGSAARLAPPLAARAVAVVAHGPGEPELDLLRRAYVRRFDPEHTFRLLKRTLRWPTPRVRHLGQADRWTWLG